MWLCEVKVRFRDRQASFCPQFLRPGSWHTKANAGVGLAPLHASPIWLRGFCVQHEDLCGKPTMVPLVVGGPAAPKPHGGVSPPRLAKQTAGLSSRLLLQAGFMLQAPLTDTWSGFYAYAYGQMVDPPDDPLGFAMFTGGGRGVTDTPGAPPAPTDPPRFPRRHDFSHT